MEESKIISNRYCNFEFRTATSIKDQPFRCPKCIRCFDKIAHMKSHFYRVHAEFRLSEYIVETLPANKQETKVQELIEKPPLKLNSQEQPVASYRKDKPSSSSEKAPIPTSFKDNQSESFFEKGLPLISNDKKLPLDITEPPSISKIKQKLHKCDECNKLFSNKLSLLTHCRIMHAKKCRSSKKEFPSKFHSNLHLGNLKQKKSCFNCSRTGKICTHSKLYGCKLCEMSFPYKISLKRHYLTHAKEKAYHCDVCGKYFALHNTLIKHMLIHHNMNRFQCVICKNSFAHQNALNIHMRTHDKKKLFMCEVCDKRFSRQDILREHYRTHTTENPYKCDKCNQSFILKRFLDSHSLTHCNAKELICSVCEEKFDKKSHLDRHIRAHKRNDNK